MTSSTVGQLISSLWGSQNAYQSVASEQLCISTREIPPNTPCGHRFILHNKHIAGGAEYGLEVLGSKWDKPPKVIGSN